MTLDILFLLVCILSWGWELPCSRTTSGLACAGGKAPWGRSPWFGWAQEWCSGWGFQPPSLGGAVWGSEWLRAPGQPGLRSCWLTQAPGELLQHKVLVFSSSLHLLQPPWECWVTALQPGVPLGEGVPLSCPPFSPGEAGKGRCSSLQTPLLLLRERLRSIFPRQFCPDYFSQFTYFSLHLKGSWATYRCGTARWNFWAKAGAVWGGIDLPEQQLSAFSVFQTHPQRCPRGAHTPAGPNEVYKRLSGSCQRHEDFWRNSPCISPAPAVYTLI